MNNINTNKIKIENLKKINDNLYEIAKSFRSDMRVPARLFANATILQDIMDDNSLLQLVNVATLPGIQKFAFAMPDIHQGYGFPIGGLAAMAIDENGIISPGGIGYDINCGVRLLVSDLTYKDIESKLEKIADSIFRAVPSGVGRSGKLKLDTNNLDSVLQFGANKMVELGYGIESDLEFCEEKGNMQGANPDKVSDRAKKRGADQLGTLGSGNHFLEVQMVEEVFDKSIADVFGLDKNLITIMIHCGSRGLGHQTCTDYVRIMLPKLNEWGIILPDRELACAPFNTKEGQDYFAAMISSCNFAWANRHVITHNVRKSWQYILGNNAKLDLLYDVSHNIGKKEKHNVDGYEKSLIVHRKGATRAFPPHHPDIPAKYRSVGQPVFIPGTMGTSSYVLAGTQEGMEKAFGTCCHGAGRKMSRIQAKKTVRGSELRKSLESRKILIRSDSDPGLAEEAPEAYKDVEQVVDIITNSGIAKKVAKLVPIAVIKGE